jgi:hypothetical protein
MQLRHTGIFVQDIKLCESILVRLGFIKDYDEYEKINYEDVIARKYYNKENKYYLELIESKTRARSNSFHLCFDGDVPIFMKQYRIEKYEPINKSLIVFFVYISDSIYFEFVKESTNEL